MIIGDEVSGQRSVVSRIGFVKKRDVIAAPLSWQEQENVVLVGRTGAKNAEIQAIGERDLELLYNQKTRNRVFSEKPGFFPEKLTQ